LLALSHTTKQILGGILTLQSESYFRWQSLIPAAPNEHRFEVRPIRPRQISDH
jgi:hypothetical protein